MLRPIINPVSTSNILRIHLLPMLKRNRITIFISSNIIETKKHLKLICWSESIIIVHYELHRKVDVGLSYSTLNSSNNMKYINIPFLWWVSLRFFLCNIYISGRGQSLFSIASYPFELLVGFAFTASLSRGVLPSISTSLLFRLLATLS